MFTVDVKQQNNNKKNNYSGGGGGGGRGSMCVWRGGKGLELHLEILHCLRTLI